MASTTKEEASSSILFLQIADKSYDEIFFIERLSQQWRESLGEPDVYACVNGLSFPFVSSQQERFVRVFTEDQEKNKEIVELLEETLSFDAVIVLDLQEYFLHPMELNFLPVWLKEFECPIYALDYFNLMTYQDDLLILRPEIEDRPTQEEPPAPLALTVELLKPVLPNTASPFEFEDHTWPFQSEALDMKLKAPQMRSEIFNSIEAKDSDYLITVFFDPFSFLQSADRQLLGYYFTLIEVLVFYLRLLKGQHFHVFIVGMTTPTLEVNLNPEINVNLHYFSHLTEDNYAAFLSASDLVVTNNTWTVPLLDALYLNTPTCIFGNSIVEAWKDDTETKKELRASFQPLKPLYDLCHMMIDFNLNAVSTPIFQFISYPQRETALEFPAPGFQEGTYPFFLLDMFDDESCLDILKGLLLSQTIRQDYADLCQRYVEQHSISTRFGQIHTQVHQDYEHPPLSS